MELSEYDEFKLYENIDIYDSGAVPYADAPLIASDTPENLETVSVTPDTNTMRPTSNTLSIPTDTSRKPETNRKVTDKKRTERTDQAISTASKAKASNNDVIYTAPDGTQFRRTGGTRAWRNMNPGNIRYSDFAKRAGAIGEAGGFAVFPDEETGMRAISQLLRSDSYNRLTVAGAISRYAPPVENNTAAYHKQIQDLTGLSINRRMSDLNDAELSRVANAIRQIEGWKQGRTIQE